MWLYMWRDIYIYKYDNVVCVCAILCHVMSFTYKHAHVWASQVALVVKKTPKNKNTHLPM